MYELAETGPEVRIWARSASDGAASLKSLHEPMERAFLGIGERLRRAHADERAMTELASGMVAVLAGQAMTESLRLLDSSVGAVRSLRNAGTDSGEDLARLSTVADSVLKPLSGLEAVVAEIEVLGINAKVEAAHIDRDTAEFTVFTHEIGRLAGRGRKVVETLRDGLEVLRAAASAALTRHASFQAGHLREFEAVADRLEASARALKGRQARGASAIERLPGEVEGVGADIASLVSGLQGGDITRQRLEHIEEALSELAVALSGGSQKGVLGPGQAVLLADAMCELQIHHLADTRKEFGARVEGIRHDLASLVERTSRLGGDAEAAYAGSDSGRHFLAELERDLAATGTMLDRYADAMDATERSLTAVVEAANAMASSMQAISDINTDMNLLGLNASIKCGNLGGKGRALNVVAQELRAYARRTGGLAGTVGDCINQVRLAVDGLSQSAGRRSSGRLKEIGIEVAAARERLGRAGGETSGLLASLAEKRGGVAASLEQARDLLRFADSFLATSAGVEQSLTTVRQQARPNLSGAELVAARKELLSLLQTRYTMASERDLHAFLLDGRLAQAPAPTRPSAAAADISDLLF